MDNKVWISFVGRILTVKQGATVIKAQGLDVDELCNHLEGISSGNINSFELDPLEPVKDPE